jgi:hypothetical protein
MNTNGGNTGINIGNQPSVSHHGIAPFFKCVTPLSITRFASFANLLQVARYNKLQLWDVRSLILPKNRQYSPQFSRKDIFVKRGIIILGQAETTNCHS